MALSASILASLIQSNLQAQGANGSNLSKFCTAVATGIVLSIVGKAFTTTDVGTVPGIGDGTGMGVMGLSSSTMSGTALGLMSSQGVNASKLMDSIMSAVVMHLGQADLISTNSPVFLGSGTVIVGSIAVMAPEMVGNIQSQLSGVGAQGVNMPNLSLAIGTGIALNIVSAGTGLVTITGSPFGDPGPGTGSGYGTIS